MEMDSIGGGGGNAVALEVRDIMKELVNNERRMLQRELDAAMDRFIDKHHDLLQSTEQTLTTWHLSRINAAKGQQPSMLEIVITNTLVVDNNPGLVEWIQDEPLRQQATECVLKLRNHLNARHGNAFRSDFEKLLTVFMEYLRIKPTSGSGLTNRVNDFKKALHEAIEATDELLSLVHRVKWACYGVRTVCNARSHDSMPLSDAEVQELCACFSALSAAMPTLAREFDTTKPQSPLSVAVPPATAVDLAGFTDMLQSGAATNSDDLQRLILQLMNSANANDAKASGSLTNSSASTPTSASFNVGAPPSLQLQPPPGYPGYPAFRSAPLTAQQPPLPAGPSPGQPPLPPRLPPGLPPAPGTPSTWRDVAQTTPTQTTSIQPLSRRVYQPTEQQIELVRGFKLFHDNPLEPLPKEKDFLRMAQFARTVIQARNVTKARMCTCYDPSCTNPHTYLEVMEYNPLYKLLVCRQQNHYLTRTVQEDDRCVCLHVDTGIAADFLEKLSDKRKMCVRGARCTSADCVKSHTVEELCWYNPSYKITKCKFQDHLVRNRSGAGPPADCKYYHDTSEMRNPKDDSDYVGKESKILFIERSHKQLADALEALRAVRNQSSW